MKSCLETTMELERSAFQRLSWKDRFGVRLHVSVCPECRKYFRDSKTLDRLMRKTFSQPKQYSFSLEEKEIMKRKLNDSAT